MKRWTSLFVILLLFATGHTQNNQSVTDTHSITRDNGSKNISVESSAISKPVINHNAFDVGERLIFKLRYGFIRAGTAEMKVLGRTQLYGNEVYHIQTKARSVSAFDWFYKVRDVVNSFTDVKGIFPYRYEKFLREG
ncbi:MAG: DUF3108 domain-containing protein, partial [Caldithrix sp.]|nr:DUF3108 domain-containing protein [Caldithrix sp.]